MTADDAFAWCLWKQALDQRFIRNTMRKNMEATFGKATLGDKEQQQKIEQACLDHLEKQVPDPALREKLTPDYRATCKRLILCSDYYPAFAQDNVELVTEKITIQSESLWAVARPKPLEPPHR